MAKPKLPHKKFQLKPIRREAYTPPPERPEPTESDRRGYWPGSNYTPQEVAWLKAVQAFQKKSGRKFLSHVDYFRLAIEILLPTASQSPPPPSVRTK